jgi:hypothetical protein
MSDKTRKTLHTLSYLSLVISFAVVILIFYWTVRPYSPLTFTSEPLLINETNVKSGSHISTDVEFCKDTDAPADLIISFVDGFVYNTPPTISNFPKGCHKVQYYVYVPRGIPEGIYHIKAVFRYEVNPIRTVDIEVQSEEFAVTK